MPSFAAIFLAVCEQVVLAELAALIVAFAFLIREAL